MAARPLVRAGRGGRGCAGGAEPRRRSGRRAGPRPRAAGGGARAPLAGAGLRRAGGGGPLPAACRTLANVRRWAGAWREGGAAARDAGCCIPGAVTGKALPCPASGKEAPAAPDPLPASLPAPAPAPLRAPRRAGRRGAAPGG